MWQSQLKLLVWSEAPDVWALRKQMNKGRMPSPGLDHIPHARK